MSEGSITAIASAITVIFIIGAVTGVWGDIARAFSRRKDQDDDEA